MVAFSWLYTLPGLEIYLAIIAIVSYSTIMILKTPKKSRTKPKIMFIILTGMMGIAGIVDILYGVLKLIGSKASADSLDRDTSPYQLQVAMATIGTGIVGSTTLLKPSFMIPAMITKISLSFGTFYSICFQFVTDDIVPDNQMILELCWSIVFPVVVLILFGLIKLFEMKQKVKETIPLSNVSDDEASALFVMEY
eukprot:793796_1